MGIAGSIPDLDPLVTTADTVTFAVAAAVLTAAAAMLYRPLLRSDR